MMRRWSDKLAACAELTFAHTALFGVTVSCTRRRWSDCSTLLDVVMVLRDYPAATKTADDLGHKPVEGIEADQ